MLKHFEQLNTPLKSVYKYPHPVDQEERFLSRGWASCQSWTLWGAWADDFFLSPEEREKLDLIEPFDEWEEFALFASHYVVLHAINSGGGYPEQRASIQDRPTSEAFAVSMNYTAHPSNGSHRRFGGAMIIENAVGEPYAAHLMGTGTNGRLKTCEVYSIGEHISGLKFGPNGPQSRLCFSLTDLGNFGILLSGGRHAPSRVFKDCWLLRKGTNQWEQAGDLPKPLFRHSVIRLGCSSLALLAGGRSSASSISEDYLLFSPESGWVKCEVSGLHPDPTFSATLAVASNPTPSFKTFCGIMAGGLRRDGVLYPKVFSWELEMSEAQVGYLQPLYTVLSSGQLLTVTSHLSSSGICRSVRVPYPTRTVCVDLAQFWSNIKALVS
jgi:tRNA wybutosine-synthesizing protein 4